MGNGKDAELLRHTQEPVPSLILSLQNCPAILSSESVLAIAFSSLFPNELWILQGPNISLPLFLRHFLLHLNDTVLAIHGRSKKGLLFLNSASGSTTRCNRVIMACRRIVQGGLWPLRKTKSIEVRDDS